MGMDVHGNNPGAYFRNSVWSWHPLWDYCCDVAPKLINTELARDGHYNDGAGLDEAGARRLATVLQSELDFGKTQSYEIEYKAQQDAVPSEPCKYCEATGIRTDEVGRANGFPQKYLSPEVAEQTGRTQGWCNACNGIGTIRPFETHYPFTAANVREFVVFLRECGGFTID